MLSRLEDRVAPAVLTLQPAAIAPVEGQQFNGTVATFTDSDATAIASHFTATINWGDGTSTAGQIVADPGVTGQFDIQGTHTYADEGHPSVIVTVTDTVAGGSATTGSFREQPSNG